MQLTVQDSQRRLLEMGKAIHGVLKRHNIQYMITFGTLLGAVRHEGFIPWDDDFDVFLFEDQYDEAIKYLRDELPYDMFVEDESSEPKYFHSWAHVKDLNTIALCEQFPQDNIYSHKGLSIDLYKALPMYESDVDLFRLKENLKYQRRKLNLGLIKQKEFDVIEKKINYSIENYTIIRNSIEVFGMVMNERMILREDVFPLRLYKFEDTEFYGPNNFDAILKGFYGKYMELPDVEHRMSHYSRVEKVDIGMLNFTVGPVMSSEQVLAIGSEQVPYFRTPEFSSVMLENERLIKKFAKAEDDAKVVFITGSGTASMEATVINVLNKNDKVLVVNGGSFGHRFVELVDIYEVPYTEIKMDIGRALTKEQLKVYDSKGYTALLVNVHETSTGVHYDIDMISEFCKRNNMLLIVDAISSFLADDFNMAKLGADIMITGSQKALACPPGISIIVLSKRAIDRVENNNPGCMYLNLKDALKNAERGQTPFTPAVGTLRQINARLKEIDAAGGVEVEMQRIADLAEDFRTKIKGLPFEIVSEAMSNAVTPLHPLNASAHDIFTILKDEYNIWICPNGGDLADKVFRVGHIGYLSKEDNTTLVNAFKDLIKRGLL